VPEILSVGIDIGTSTTQVVFSKLSIKNTAGQFSVPRVSIVSKELVYTSSIYTTPLLSAFLLDGDGIRKIVENEFSTAGFSPGDTDTGAVIITGESARKENAELITKKLSDLSGDFVVATAGPDLESVLAGKGSGAYQYSIDKQCVTMNLDIGGGTANIAVFDCGNVIAKGCYDIGGRLIRLNHNFTVAAISPAAKIVALTLGISLQPGQLADVLILQCITDKMAHLLCQAVGLAPQEPLLAELKTPQSSKLVLPDKAIAAVYFSGGIADQIYNNSPLIFQYGDIGVLLGKSVRASELYTRMPVIRARETIRATVVGAGTYATTVSGSTIAFFGDLFPIKNVPVLKLNDEEQEQCFNSCGDALYKRVRWFREQHGVQTLVLAMCGEKNPEYLRLKQLAQAVFSALNRALPAGEPILLVLEHDMAKAVGMMLNALSNGHRQIAVLDGIHVEDGDYLDMGRPLANEIVIPVVIKTLIFG
jgi:ethanolamine utilization protein EutA